MYKKTQFGRVGFYILIGVVVFGVILTFFISATDGEAKSMIVPITVPPLLILLVIKDLTVSVDDEFIRLVYGIGLLKFKFKLSDIQSCKRIENAFVMGWGIRLGWGYTLYNISGRDSVELTFFDGRRMVRIGTADLDGLFDAINSKIRS